MSEFTARYRANLAVLRSRFAGVADMLEAWTDRYDIEANPAEGGGYYLRGAGPSGVPLSNAKNPEYEANVYARSNTPSTDDRPPVLLTGVGAGYEARAFLPYLYKESGGRQQGLYLVEIEVEVFKAAMHLVDWTELLSAPHVFVFVGPSAIEQFSDFLAADPMKPLPKAVCSRGDRSVAERAGAAVAEVWKQRALVAREIKTRLDAYYGDHAFRDRRDAKHWRVLLISSGWSHFVQYANRDIAHALEALGHEVRTIAERDRVDAITGPALLAALDEFRPHLLHHIDHMRFESSAIYPTDIPFLTSILDYFPSLENEEAAARLGAFDFVTGYVAHWGGFGYSKQQLFPQDPMVNEAIFRPLNRADASLDPYRCEASYVSNFGQTPEDYFDSNRARIASLHPAAESASTELFERVRERFESGSILWSELDYRDLLRGTKFGPRLTASAEKAIAHWFFSLIGNAWFRQQPLIALSEAGVDLHLYGRHWERHPLLGRHARGVIEHGEELNKLFNASAINLHINQFAVRHNRLYEGLASGGFFLVHTHTDADRTGLELGDVLFQSGPELVTKARDFLARPEERERVVQANRARVLDRFTFTRQYQKTLPQLRRRLGFTDLTHQWRQAILAIDAPICPEAFSSTSLGAWTERVAGVDVPRALADLAPDEADYAIDVAQVFRATVSAAVDHDRNLSAQTDSPAKKSASERGVRFFSPDPGAVDGTGELVLRPARTVALDFVGTPYLCATSPDGRLAISDGPALEGDTNEHTTFLFDVSSGTVAPIATAVGLNAGAYGPDGNYYAQVAGRGICRFDEGGPVPVFDPARDGIGVVLQTLVTADGRFVVWDRASGRVALFSPDGRESRDLLHPNRFADVRGLSVDTTRLYACVDGRLIAVPLEGTPAITTFPPPPYGRWFTTCPVGGGVFTGLYTPIRLKTGRLGSRIRALAAFDAAGSMRCYWDGLEDVPLPFSLNVVGAGAGRRLALTSYQRARIDLFEIDRGLFT